MSANAPYEFDTTLTPKKLNNPNKEKENMPKEKDDRESSDAQAMELIKSSGLLTPSFTLEKLMTLTGKLATIDISVGAPISARWTFISKYYVYKGDQA